MCVCVCVCYLDLGTDTQKQAMFFSSCNILYCHIFFAVNVLYLKRKVLPVMYKVFGTYET